MPPPITSSSVAPHRRSSICCRCAVTGMVSSGPGHRQFCEQFLNPLLLRSKLGIPHNGWYRGTLEGIGVAEINRLLPWHKKLSFNVLTHIVLQDTFQRKAQASGPGLAKTAVGKAVLPLASSKHMLVKLGRWIESLEPADTGKTVWRDYARSHSYTDDEARAKRDFVAEFASAVKPAMSWDMGCNTGDYSQAGPDGPGASCLAGRHLSRLHRRGLCRALERTRAHCRDQDRDGIGAEIDLVRPLGPWLTGEKALGGADCRGGTKDKAGFERYYLAEGRVSAPFGTDFPMAMGAWPGLNLLPARRRITGQI